MFLWSVCILLDISNFAIGTTMLYDAETNSCHVLEFESYYKIGRAVQL